MKNVISILTLATMSACIAPQGESVDAAVSAKSAADTRPTHDILGFPYDYTMDEDTVCLYYGYSYNDGVHAYNTNVSINSDTWESAASEVSTGLSYDCSNTYMVDLVKDGIERMMADQGYANQVSITCENNTSNQAYPGGNTISQARLKIQFLNSGIKFGGRCAKGQ